jgi:hypothetical protein
MNAFCRRMHVSRNHVYKVLTGQRQSPRLLALWEKWQPLYFAIQEQRLQAGLIGKGPKPEPVSAEERVARIAAMVGNGRRG